MKARYERALSRALAEWSGLKGGTLLSFLRCAVSELRNECGSEYASLAFIIRQHDGTTCVGVPREVESLPIETLLGLLVEEAGGRAACRVKDHSLDSVRFIDNRFRTSIIARVTFAEASCLGREGAIWFGLPGAATPAQVDHANVIAQEVTEWLSVHSPVVQKVLDLRLMLSSGEDKFTRMRMLAHDTRAPLAALKYLIADLIRAHPHVQDEVGRLRREIAYVDTLLGNFAPSADEERAHLGQQSNVRKVVHRVCDRFSLEAAVRGCSIHVESSDDSELSVGMPELELERVVSNIIGNAARYASGGVITVHYGELDCHRVKLRVSDTGPGFPQPVLDGFELEGGVGAALSGTNGWGVGLISCKRSLARWGGECRLLNGPTGAIVEIYLAQPDSARRKRGKTFHDTSVPPQSTYPESVRFPGTEVVRDKEAFRYGESGSSCFVIIDDDVEHTASLARLLTRSGVRIESFTEVKAACETLSSGEVLGVICDVHMPDGGSDCLLRLLASSGINMPCAVMSGEISEDELYRLAARGASECFQKPIEYERLMQWIRLITKAPPGNVQLATKGVLLADAR